jgi:O-antigen ligase
LLYLVFEYGRPSHPLGIPMVISALLLGGWLVSHNTGRRLSPQVLCFFGFVVLIFVGVPMATNSYSAFWAAYGMATLLVCICVPMTRFVTSVRHVRWWLYSFIGVAVYVGGYAIFHSGFGPAGAAGAQDENYVAAMMGMAVACAYFCIQAEKRRFGKILLVLCVVVFCTAIVVSFSRGGFVGLCAVVAYCLVRARRKLVGFGVAALLGLTVLAVAGPAYWEEMSTISDVNEGTADLRLEVWKIGLRMFAANPLLGVGADNFRWVELGAVGACLVLIVIWYTVRDLRRARKVETLRHYADAVTGSIVACMVNGLFISLFYFSYVWLFIALAAALKQVAGAPQTPTRAPAAEPVTVFPLALMPSRRG